jgi:hypothetical protein
MHSGATILLSEQKTQCFQMEITPPPQVVPTTRQQATYYLIIITLKLLFDTPTSVQPAILLLCTAVM